MIAILRHRAIILFLIFQQLINHSFGYIPHPDHVVVVVLENHSINEIVGSPDAPYLNSLINDSKSALFTQSFALLHPSQPNYIQIFSGSNQGVTNDNVPSIFPFDYPNLGASLLANSKTFIGYSEDLPSVGYNGASSGAYARKHNPWVNWQGNGLNGIPDSCNQPFTAFPTNYNLLPSLSFVVPNQENDMHNGSDPTRITIGDTWVHDYLDGYIQWAKTHNSLLIITFDEDDNTAAQNIFTLFIGQMVQDGIYTNHIDHYNVLHLLEDMFYLPHSGASATATTIDYCWVSCNQAAVITPPGPITLCQGTSVTLNASAGAAYLWSNGATTPSITVSTAGNYSVSVSNGLGCSATSTILGVTTSAFSADQVVFNETMGTVAATTPISTHESNNGFDNDNLTVTGTADVRNTTPSNGYANASGGANIFVTNIVGRNFIVSDINTTGLSNLQLTIGIFKSRIISTGSDLLIRVSADGINYTNLTLAPLPTGSGTAIWYSRTVTGTIPATSNLRIQFLQTDTVTQYRIDDISLKYLVTPTSISAGGPTSFCQGGSVSLNSSFASSYLWSNGATTQNISAITSGNYYVKGILANGCGIFSNIIPVNVDSNLAPIVTISSNLGSTICAGANVDFTAYPLYGGTSPTFQWKKNGIIVGAQSSVYSDNSLLDSDIINCVMTSNSTCLQSNTATSNSIPITIVFNVTPQVSINVNTGINICSGVNATFTATSVNGGSSPSYQWKRNGNNIGANSSTYSNNSLLDNDIISCVMTSNAACPLPLSASSNTITMNITQSSVALVSINPNTGNTICAGTNVTLTATPINGGSSPTYQWRRNGAVVGSNQSSYSSSALANNDTISCLMTSNGACINPSQALSNNVVMVVNPIVVPAISITSNAGSSVCPGTNVTFTAVPSNGGTTPSYQWKRNGTVIGTNANTFSSNSLVTGDVITCVLTGNNPCASPATATSNSIVMNVNSHIITSISISSNTGSTICPSANVTFTAVPVNGGVSPSFQWFLNGHATGANSNTYSNNAFITGDTIMCTLTSTSTCGSQTASSNNIVMTVNPSITPSVSIGSNTANPFCSGTNVTFTATPVNGGSTPVFQWRKNGINVGTNSATYVNNSLLDSDIISCMMTSSAQCPSPSTATSTSLTVAVSPILTPSVTITANTGNVICSGTNVTFNATPVNGGSTPSYQWKRNGTNIGANSSSYSNNSLANNDVITCVMTSNATCVSPATATSNSITIVVDPNISTSVTIAANPGNVICEGTSVTFNASPVNGGSSPVYQWKKNGTVVGNNSGSYTDNTLINGATILCTMTSNSTCGVISVATSNTIHIIADAPVAPSVTTLASPGTSVCQGTNVTFNANPINGGANPTYQWKKNGLVVGFNSSAYNDNVLINGDIITCVMTSNAACVLPSTATSTAITMTIIPTVTPSVTIVSNPAGAICAGTNITFTATPVNGGSTPVYQWKKNGNNTGTNSNVFSSASLVSNDLISCIMTSNAVCPSPASASSNGISVTVNAFVTPSVSIVANPGTTICAGTNVTFTASQINGGTSPSYQWKKNGTIVGLNQNTYSDNSLINNDAIVCSMTSNASCVTQSTANSNLLNISVINLAPSISSFNPTSAVSGTTITIDGSNFNGITSVTFNGAVASFSVINSNQITALVPANATSGLIQVSNICGSGSSGSGFVVIPTATLLNIKLFIEGYYIGSGLMRSPLGGGFCDTIIVELHENNAPYNTIYSAKGVINTSGNGTFVFPTSVAGNSYFISVFSHNALKTWSATAVAFTSNISYDFTSVASKAYGNNLRDLGDGNFALYSGDVIQDGIINMNDYNEIMLSCQLFRSGYLKEDLTGDKVIESGDFSLIENNNLLRVTMRP